MQTINDEFLINAICEATSSVFATMLEGDVERHLSSDEDQDPEGGVVSLVGLTGPWTGTGSIACTPTMAGAIASRLLMIDAPDGNTVMNEEIMDAVAELTNMVIGCVKNSLEERIGPMGISIPTVIYGRNFQFRSLTGDAPIRVPFLWQGGQVVVRLSIAPSVRRAVPERVRAEQMLVI